MCAEVRDFLLMMGVLVGLILIVFCRDLVKQIKKDYKAKKETKRRNQEWMNASFI